MQLFLSFNEYRHTFLSKTLWEDLPILLFIIAMIVLVPMSFELGCSRAKVIWHMTTLWQHRDRICDRICDGTVIVKWQANFFLDHDRHRVVKWAHMLGNMGRYHPIWGDNTQYRAILGRYRAISGDIRAISGDIGQYRTISEDIGVIWSSVKSVMYLARPIQVVPGQLIF